MMSEWVRVRACAYMRKTENKRNMLISKMQFSRAITNVDINIFVNMSRNMLLLFLHCHSNPVSICKDTAIECEMGKDKFKVYENNAKLLIIWQWCWFMQERKKNPYMHEKYKGKRKIHFKKSFVWLKLTLCLCASAHILSPLIPWQRSSKLTIFLLKNFSSQTRDFIYNFHLPKSVNFAMSSPRVKIKQTQARLRHWGKSFVSWIQIFRFLLGSLTWTFKSQRRKKHLIEEKSSQEDVNRSVCVYIKCNLQIQHLCRIFPPKLWNQLVDAEDWNEIRERQQKISFP